MKNSSIKQKQRQKQEKRNSLRYYLLTGGVIFLTLAALWWFVRPTVDAPPAITVDQSQIDFGNVKLGTPLTFTIKVTNTGQGTLKFKEAPYIEVLEGC